jgi:hypothetical protein
MDKVDLKGNRGEAVNFPELPALAQSVRPPMEVSSRGRELPPSGERGFAFFGPRSGPPGMPSAVLAGGAPPGGGGGSVRRW